MSAAESVTAFIARWSSASPSERANSQLFLTELYDILGVPHPDATLTSGYPRSKNLLRNKRKVTLNLLVSVVLSPFVL